jgi:signal recognition particle subunit SRP54
MSMMEKMMSGSFNFNDLLKQMKMIKKMGAFSGILKMLPGMSAMQNVEKVDDKQIVYVEAIISSMTKEERIHPELVERSSGRRSRIASGSGRSTTEVNRLIAMLEKQQKMMKQLSQMNPSSVEKMATGGTQTPTSSRNRGKGKGGFRI